MKKILALMFISVVFVMAGERGDAFAKGHAAETSEEAVKWYKKALSLCGESEKIPKAWAYNNIGFVYVKESRWDDALEWLEKAVAEDEKNHAAWNNLGITYENIGFIMKKKFLKDKTAKKDAAGEAAKDPEIEYLQKALKAYQKCVKLKPDEEKYKVNKLRVESLLQVK
ncbi:MAG: tetratricopeptide repeat protein [Candidatus Firestonebacteria bacterium]